jgi:hypothetical protein
MIPNGQTEITETSRDNSIETESLIEIGLSWNRPVATLIPGPEVQRCQKFPGTSLVTRDPTPLIFRASMVLINTPNPRSKKLWTLKIPKTGLWREREMFLIQSSQRVISTLWENGMIIQLCYEILNDEKAFGIFVNRVFCNTHKKLLIVNWAWDGPYILVKE